MDNKEATPLFKAKAAAWLCAAGLLACIAYALFQSVEAHRLRSQMLVLLSEEEQLRAANDLALVKMLKEQTSSMALGYYSDLSTYSAAKTKRDERIREIRTETGRLRAEKYSHFTRTKWSAGLCVVFALAAAGFLWVHRRQSGAAVAGSMPAG